MSASSDRLEDVVGEGLVALGLYVACFEAMVLAFRAKTYEYLLAHDPDAVPLFLSACKTAHRTFEFCGPRLVWLGAIDQPDYDSLNEIRERRNELAHEGYNHVFTLKLADLDDDLRQINRVTVRTSNWQVARGPHSPTEDPSVVRTVKASVSPALTTNVVRQVAEQVVWCRLRNSDRSGTDPQSAV